MSHTFSPKSFFYSWILPVLVGLVVVYTYFSPILQGKVIAQDDIMLGYAKNKQIKDYREKTGEEPLWTDAMFSGMPTFQLSTRYPNNWLSKIHVFFSSVFGKSSWLYVFPILVIAFFLMGRSYSIDPWLSIMGALAFAFSAFFIISFAAGHVSKVRTAAYIPIIIIGIVLTYRGAWKSGFSFTAIGFGLSILSNHFQITFYTLLIILCIGIVYLVDFIKKKRLTLFLKRSVIILGAAILGAAPNFGHLWTTMSYTKETIRGANTRLVEKSETGSSEKEGLTWEYAMAWSMGKAETLNLFIPFLTGGGAKESYEGTETYERLQGIFRQQGMGKTQAQQTANQYSGSILYWGDQSLVNGAYYVGAGMVFLFVLGLLIIKGPTRSWIIAATVLSIFMAWGLHFEAFNRILFDYLPLYNKFRVPSMALVIVFFLVPLSAVLGLKEAMNANNQKEVKKKLLFSLYITGGLALFIGLIGPSLFDLSSVRDARFIEQGFSEDMILGDRASLLRSSAFKSLLFVLATFGVVWLYVNQKIKKPVFLGLLLFIVCIDLIPFDRDQLGAEEFVTEKNLLAESIPSPADQIILNDDDLHYRVFNSTAGLTSDSYTSYHHKSIGGYHGAKLVRYQDLIENQLSRNNLACYNMLNAKWIISRNQKGIEQAQLNPNACGNAWFVKKVTPVDGPRAEMDGMNNFDPLNEAFIDEREFDEYIATLTSAIDSGTINEISLTHYDPKHLKYKASVSSPEALAVFSEIYYKAPGQEWHAFIDGEEAEHIRVNYLLRGLKVPQGVHEIEFRFIPKTYFMGQKIDLFSSILLFGSILFLILLGLRNTLKKQGNPNDK